MKQKTSQQWISTLNERERTLRKKWLEDADRVVKVYEEGKQSYNILFANTETLQPALYNSVPRPDVGRRFTSRDQKERQLDWAIAQASERTLEYFTDTNDEGYESFDEAIQAAVFDGLVPGQGVVRVRLKQEGGYQAICYEHVLYDRFLWGYARKWVQVPWVAFGHDMTKEAFEATFPDVVKTEEYGKINWDEKAEDDATGDEKKGRIYGPTTLVWEIWEHESKRIQFVADLLPERFLKEEDYPCNLSSRFPCPKPLQFVQRSTEVEPKPMYLYYEKLAQDLEETTRRLSRVIKAIRVRGVYNSQIAEFERVLGDENDNALIPSENANSLFTEKGGLEANIWLMPIDMLVKVAQQLYVAQGNIKQTIFEMMGIADIQRGATAAGETASAQQIKDKWSSVRLKRNQRAVAAFCRSLLRISLEIAAERFTPGTFSSITRLKLPMSPMPPMPMGPQGGPPPLQPPSWMEVTGLMKDQLQRTYRVDIETNSTVDLEATEDKESIAEFMNAFGQMMAGFKPLLDGGALAPELAKEILLEVTKRYRFGRRVEAALEQMQPPKPQDEGADKAKEMQFKAREKVKDAQHAEEVTRLVGELERTRLALQEAKIGGKLRETELTADFAGKMRTKDLKVADTVMGSKMKEQAAELQRIQQSIAQQIQGALKQIQVAQQNLAQAKAPDPALQMGLEQQSALLVQMQQSQGAMIDAIGQLTTAVAAPRVKELIEDAEGNVIGVRETVEPPQQEMDDERTTDLHD